MTQEQAKELAREIDEDYEQPYSAVGIYEDMDGQWRVVITDRPVVVRSENDWQGIRRRWIERAA